MMEIQSLYEKISAEFGDKVLGLDTENSSPAKISCAPDALLDVCRSLKNDPDSPFDSLMSLSGIDTGGDLGAVLHLHSFKTGMTLTVEALTDRENPVVDSVSSLYRTADWHEREAYDMYGIIFNGHPNLTRMFLGDDWEGHPLRKDYVAAEYWHGMPIAKELTEKMR